MSVKRPAKSSCLWIEKRNQHWAQLHNCIWKLRMKSHSKGCDCWSTNRFDASFRTLRRRKKWVEEILGYLIFYLVNSSMLPVVVERVPDGRYDSLFLPWMEVTQQKEKVDVCRSHAREALSVKWNNEARELFRGIWSFLNFFFRVEESLAVWPRMKTLNKKSARYKNDKQKGSRGERELATI